MLGVDVVASDQHFGKPKVWQMSATQETSQRPVRVLLFSDDRTVREQVRLVLGRRVAADLPEIEVEEVATAPYVIRTMQRGGIDLVILDAEANPEGGMGVARQLKDEVPDCPPLLLLVIRRDDAWLATWSRVDAVAAFPPDPVSLPQQAAELLRARLGQNSGTEVAVTR